MTVPTEEEVCSGLELFPFAEARRARYLRFKPGPGRGNGPALAYFGIMEPGSRHLLLEALEALIET